MENKFTFAPKPYIPAKLPLNLHQHLQDRELLQLMLKANASVGTYSGFLKTIMNPMLLISPIISQEAVLSSKLEGTHATLEDVLNYEAGNKVDIESDEIQEIINYRKSLFYALEIIEQPEFNSPGKLPLSNRVIKSMHGILLDNVRGNTKRPGQFKIRQNYIGSRNHITFTPVSAELTEEYMSNLENYIHYEEIDLILQSAILHAQFEMIHPFEDGNGRIGRLLIPLFLYYRGLLPYPTFYMSAYFESDRALYLSHLSNISKEKNWNDWFKYYLNGVIISSESSTKKAEKILGLYNHMKTEIIPTLKSTSGIDLLDFIFSAPIFNAHQVSEKLSNISQRTVYTLLNKLQSTGFLTSTNEKKNKTYYCPQLLSIVE